MSTVRRFTRRGFLKGGAGALAGLGAGTLAASRLASVSTARTAERVGGANERLTFGVIGVGGMGSAHLGRLIGMAEQENIEVAAVCDVYRRRANAGAQRAGCKAYADYRKLLDDKSIDAVVIATPDHWHFKNASDALDADKHVYLEKPMVHTIDQIFSLRDKARRKRALAVQIGAQHTSYWQWWSANEQIKDGLIGDVLWSQAGVARNSREGEWNYPIDPNAGPHASGDDHIDWDMWVGHAFGCAPETDWNPEHFFRFRKCRAYSGGIARVVPSPNQTGTNQSGLGVYRAQLDRLLPPRVWARGERGKLSGRWGPPTTTTSPTSVRPFALRRREPLGRG